MYNVVLTRKPCMIVMAMTYKVTTLWAKVSLLAHAFLSYPSITPLTLVNEVARKPKNKHTHDDVYPHFQILMQHHRVKMMKKKHTEINGYHVWKI
jgi:hypothetical protein